MARLIDADKLKKHYEWWQGGTREMSMDEAKSDFDVIVNLQPTVDAEFVVRCKDCFHYHKGYVLPEHCALTGWETEPNDYCSSGERKGGGENG